MNKNSYISIILILSICLLLFACKDSNPTLPTESPTGLIIQGGSVGNLTVNETITLTATVTFKDGSSKEVTQEAKWTSSNTDFTTVAKGVVIGVAMGDVTITAPLVVNWNGLPINKTLAGDSYDMESYSTHANNTFLRVIQYSADRKDLIVNIPPVVVPSGTQGYLISSGADITTGFSIYKLDETVYGPHNSYDLSLSQPSVEWNVILSAAWSDPSANQYNYVFPDFTKLAGWNPDLNFNPNIDLSFTFESWHSEKSFKNEWNEIGNIDSVTNVIGLNDIQRLKQIGVWKTACSDAGNGPYIETHNFLPNNELLVTVDAYLDATCVNIGTTESLKFIYIFRADTTSTTGRSAIEIDLSPTEQNNIPIPIAMQNTWYTIIAIDTSVLPAQLYVTVDVPPLDGSTPAARTMTLDETLSLSKQ